MKEEPQLFILVEAYYPLEDSIRKICKELQKIGELTIFKTWGVYDIVAEVRISKYKPKEIREKIEKMDGVRSAFVLPVISPSKKYDEKSLG